MSEKKRSNKQFDKYIAKMRAAGCVVIAYSPDDLRNAIAYQLGTSSDEKFEFHPLVDLADIAKDAHEDDSLWDALSESVA